MKGIKKFWTLAGLLLFILSMSAVSFAEDTEVKELKKKVEILTEEVEKLKLGGVAEPKYESFKGLGPAASKVYGIDKGISLGGYGEAFFSRFQDSSKKDIADTQRFVLYGGYKYNDWLVMNSELEFEHAGIDNVGNKKPEVYVEFMYLDFLLKPTLNVRTGLILMPIGFINEYHEPTVRHGVLRPDVETNIIPSTWREMGVMAYGTPVDGLEYKLGIFNGLRADRIGKSDFIRGGRQQGAKVNADALAGLLNLNYTIMPGLKIGGTYYIGEAEEKGGGEQVTANEKMGTVKLWEVHAEYKFKGLELRGLYTQGTVSGNNALETATNIPKEVQGWYVEAAYDIMPHLRSGSLMSLTPFFRYESYDTNKEVFTGTPDKTMDRRVTTFGLDFKPIPNVVIKADYQWRDTDSDLPKGKGTGLDENKISQFNLGIGFIF